MADGKSRVASTFIVTVSVLLQLGAIGSPGWLTIIHGNTEVYTNIFYKLSCTTLVTRECDAKTYYTMYKDKRRELDLSAGTEIAKIQQDKEMHDDLQDMVLLALALLCTFVIFIAQWARSCNREKRYTRVVTASPPVLTFAAGLILSVIARYWIYNYYMSDLRSLDKDRDHTYIGFPYSVAMFSAACMFNLMAAIMQICQVTGAQKKPRKKKQTFDDDIPAAVPVQTKLPVAQTTTVEETPVSVKQTDNVYDNPTFSVKL